MPILDPSVVVVCREPMAGRVEQVLVRGGLTVLACVDGLEALEELSQASHPHVVVIVAGDQDDASSWIHGVWASLPHTRVVLVLRDDRTTAVRDAMRAGADGVVRETDLAMSLTAVARSVSLGYAVVPLDDRSVLTRQQLSVREREILGLAADGLTNAEISLKLHLAESTVKSHLSSVFSKLGVRSRAELPAVLREGREGRPGLRESTRLLEGNA
jgi:DNA-binding NarL/FixJ family response regulator